MRLMKSHNCRYKLEGSTWLMSRKLLSYADRFIHLSQLARSQSCDSNSAHSRPTWWWRSLAVSLNRKLLLHSRAKMHENISHLSTFPKSFHGDSQQLIVSRGARRVVIRWKPSTHRIYNCATFPNSTDPRGTKTTSLLSLREQKGLEWRVDSAKLLKCLRDSKPRLMLVSACKPYQNTN